ncbi:uncharacterized protein At2g38710 isoform X2 [Selaginella moellendorffii]|uniref:uncharacterized protein At2g38710 isoform X2 n=1 Tax=Selaginella moellendorffii TaxID=88036 RepID=UPI000D1C5925|nr:uncharacterized protein At2g38710 isoform X2 [Selaginella moellendorffii]|eukprot:XP_024520809.1 uncharacterized protein At2g38710 isoform X2 [Selaginella moellendorffii]
MRCCGHGARVEDDGARIGGGGGSSSTHLWRRLLLLMKKRRLAEVGRGSEHHRTRRSSSTMVSASKEMAVYCFDTLVAHYTGDVIPTPDFEEGNYPLFVTWKKVVNGGEPRLRGCIGTLEARCLITGFKDYALTSALRDRRFPPIQAREIPFLECTVSILTDYESAANYLDWEIGKHGMILEFTDPDNLRRSATYLPEVSAQEGALESLATRAHSTRCTTVTTSRT